MAVPGLNNGLKCNSEHACLHMKMWAQTITNVFWLLVVHKECIQNNSQGLLQFTAANASSVGAWELCMRGVCALTSFSKFHLTIQGFLSDPTMSNCTELTGLSPDLRINDARNFSDLSLKYLGAVKVEVAKRTFTLLEAHAEALRKICPHTSTWASAERYDKDELTRCLKTVDPAKVKKGVTTLYDGLSATAALLNDLDLSGRFRNAEIADQADLCNSCLQFGKDTLATRRVGTMLMSDSDALPAAQIQKVLDAVEKDVEQCPRRQPCSRRPGR